MPVKSKKQPRPHARELREAVRRELARYEADKARGRLPKKNATRPATTAVARGKRAVERFTGHAAKGGAKRIVLPDTLADVGHVVRIEYVARKRGDKSPTRYFHDFSKPPRLYAGTNGRTLVIPARWTARGIEG